MDKEIRLTRDVLVVFRVTSDERRELDRVAGGRNKLSRYIRERLFSEQEDE